MSHILHMSDFHLGKDIKVEKLRLQNLAHWISNQNIHIDYLVYTGDMIDAPTILSVCIRKLKRKYPDQFKALKQNADNNVILEYVESAGAECISAYNDTLKSVTCEYMEQAGNIFLDFVKSIDVDTRCVILCCGNHDRMRFAKDESVECTKKHPVDESTLDKPFVAYNQLCKKINCNLSHQTTLYSRDNINFIVVNSNWSVPENNISNQMCIHCGNLAQHLSNLRQETDFNKKHNLLIAHKPPDDFCESTKYNYQGESLTVSEMVDRTVDTILYGDKHSFSIKMRSAPKELMCGAPLSGVKVRYNLINYDLTFGVVSCDYILNNGDNWLKIPITDCQETVYDYSQPYLKGYAYQLLCSESRSLKTWDLLAQTIQNAINNGIFENLSKMFASFIDLRQGKKSVQIDSTNYFEELVHLIENSSVQALGIKGCPGLGKSTFMTLTYLQMLYMFSVGKTRYIPFYFNFEYEEEKEKIDASEDCVLSTYINGRIANFSAFLHGCCELGKKYNLPICLYLDGLEKSKILGTTNRTIEKQVYTILTNQWGSSENRYVMCLNSHNSYHFQDSFGKVNGFTYVLFFNKIRVLPYKKDEAKLEAFLLAYMFLTGKNIDAIETVKEALIKFRVPAVDLFFFHYCDNHIFSIDVEQSTWETLKYHLSNLEVISDKLFGVRIESVRKAAGLLFSQRKCYSEMEDSFGDKNEKPTITEYLSLVNAPIITNYLTAEYYVDQLQEYSNSIQNIPQNSILFSFIPHEISILIRLILDEKDYASELLQRFINLHHTQLTGFLYSTLVYLCGHLRQGDPVNLIKMFPKPIDGNLDFFGFCSKRSYDFAVSIHAPEKFPVEKQIVELMDSERYRKFNRGYQLHYYQDISNHSINNQIPWNIDITSQFEKGFGFRSTFLILLSKLEPVLKEKQPRYPLMQLDLFTLCDLTYASLQNVSVTSLFYSAKYNQAKDSECDAILSKLLELLKVYNKSYGGKKSTNIRVGAYFSLMYARFEKIKKAVSANRGKDVSVPYVSPCYDFETIERLSWIPRVGWNIKKRGPVFVEDQPSYDDTDFEKEQYSHQMKESIMQHIMEAVYIAQLYLPDSLPEERYDKSKVISLLLLSELGKAFMGKDYSPNYSNAPHLKKNEAECLAEISVFGALDGYAQQPYMLKPLTDRAYTTYADVNERICWEIKMIQQEHKYYCLHDSVDFTPDRRDEFEEDFEEPITDVCKSIREQLILNNPKFVKFFNNEE